jgi:hypothetical protein
MKSLQEAYNSMYPQEVQEDVVEQEVNIYEEAYLCLLDEGYDDNDATEIVNYLYENNFLDSEDVELQENIKARAMTALLGPTLKMLNLLPKKKAVQAATKAVTTGTKGTLRQGKLLTKGGKAQNFTGGRTPFVGTDPVKATRRLPQGSVSPSTSPGQLTIPGMGGKVIKTPKSTGGLLGTRNVPDIKQVSRKYGMDTPAPVPAWGGGKTGTGYPKGTPASGGALVGATRSDLTQKVKDALPSTRGGAFVKSGAGMVPSDGGPVIPAKVKVLTPPTPKLSGGSQKSLPTSNIVKSTTKSGTKTGLRKRDIAAALGGAALGFGVTKAVDDSTRKKDDLNAPTTLADREPKVEPKVAPSAPKVEKPKDTVVPSTKKQEPKTAPKATTTTTPKATTTTTPKSEPKVTAKEIRKKMTKIDRDVEELMQMRAASLDRQGKSKEAEKLRGEIKQKYSGYER